MSVNTVLVVGAGPALGYSVAERFGREGFSVALISRDQGNLDVLTTQLGALGIDAAGFTGDVADRESLRAAITAAKARFGIIDVLEYSPAPDPDSVLGALSITPENASHHVGRALLGAITAVGEVLPDMIECDQGTILFTTGASAVVPLPSHASVGLGMSALRNYAHAMHAALRDTGVYVGTLMVATRIQAGGEGDPAVLADTYWRMYTERDVFETVAGDLAAVARLASE